ncbi:Phage protein [Pseudomonas aeruginosa SCV20265]|nr:Phage protein [Pseudomonas aeruginosa SCV20265]
MQPFLDDLHAMVVNDRGLPPLDRIIDVLASHHSLVVQLIAQAADVELEWIEELPARPGKNLMFLWWIVNGPFFVGEVMDRISAERAELSSHAGPTPMPASSPEATAASPTSGA